MARAEDDTARAEDDTARAEDDTAGHRGEMGRATVVGAVGGLVGAVVMGLILQFGTNLLPVLGGLLGMPGLLWGWVVNLLLGAFYGAVFAGVLASPSVHRFVPIDTFSEYVLAGIIYATFVAMASIGMFPFISEILQPGSPPISPSQTPVTEAGMFAAVPAIVLTLGHFVYGAILGAAYSVLQGTGPGDEEERVV
jgi:hypothetical protein